jgi:hypothetical protein
LPFEPVAAECVSSFLPSPDIGATRHTFAGILLSTVDMRAGGQENNDMTKRAVFDCLAPT